MQARGRTACRMPINSIELALATSARDWCPIGLAANAIKLQVATAPFCGHNHIGKGQVSDTGADAKDIRMEPCRRGGGEGMVERKAVGNDEEEENVII